MIDSSWEWTIISLIGLVVGYYAYRKILNDFYDQWNTRRVNDSVSEELNYPDYNGDKAPVEKMLLDKTKTRSKQGFSRH